MDIHQEAWEKFRAQVLNQLRTGEFLPPSSRLIAQYMDVRTFGDVVCIDVIEAGNVVSANRTIWDMDKDLARFLDPVEFLKQRHSRVVSIQTVAVDCSEAALKRLVDVLGSLAEHSDSDVPRAIQLDGMSHELRVGTGVNSWSAAWGSSAEEKLPDLLRETIEELRIVLC